MNWIKDIDYNQFLSDDEKDMVETIGFDNYVKLLGRFKKTTFYFTDRAFLNMKKKFIVENKTVPPKQLARDLELSEMTVYNVLREATIAKNDDNYNLFEEQENR